MNTIGVFKEQRDALAKYLKLLEPNSEVNDILDDSLWKLLEDFFSNPGKNIRPKLVELGFKLASSDESEANVEAFSHQLEIASSVVESIHAGALIIDDIQDGSEVRRNSPSLHLKYGLPLALNAGNWLYFWGLEQIQSLNLNVEVQSKLTEECLRYMSRAHMGQAIDLGTQIDGVVQNKVREICQASMELKTGTLLSLALRLGAAVGGKTEGFEKLDLLGIELGTLLQKFDDIGNLSQRKTMGASKRLEDLKLRRPSWVWAMAASRFNEVDYQDFIKSVHALPCEEKLDDWVRKHNFMAMITTEITLELNQFTTKFRNEWESTHQESTSTIVNISKILEKAYV